MKMLPPESGCLSFSVAKSGPACLCIQKPLPCLVDQWVSGPSVPFEQPLSIQTDMEYTLDTRMFPGWDPVTGKTEPALVIDTAALASTGATAVGAATPHLSSPVSSPHHITPTRNTNMRMLDVQTTPKSHHPYRTRGLSRRQQSALASEGRVTGAWVPTTGGVQVLPATPGQVPALPHGHAAAYHPAFRPTDPMSLYPAVPNFNQQQHPTPRTVRQVPRESAAIQESDIINLIAAIDVDPPGYNLDVDWLLQNNQPPNVAFNNSNAVIQHQQRPAPRRLTRQQAQLQNMRVSSHNVQSMPTSQISSCCSTPSSNCPSSMVTSSSSSSTSNLNFNGPYFGMRSNTTMAPHDIFGYQSQFYPGALVPQQQSKMCHFGGNLLGLPSQQQPQLSQHQQSGMGLSAIVQPSPYVTMQRSRAVKRRLPVDSPCEGSLPSHYQPQSYCHNIFNHPLTTDFIDLTMAKRARWSVSANPNDLALHAHVPSPLQARAY